jgi:hypothetical protein
MHGRDGVRLDGHDREHGVDAREYARGQPGRQLADDAAFPEIVERRFVAHVRSPRRCASCASAHDVRDIRRQGRRDSALKPRAPTIRLASLPTRVIR